MLEINNISFEYNKENEILKNISFQLLQGENLCVMGESGSGKSTLLKVIYGLLNLKSGQIFWKKQEVLGPANQLIPGMDFFKYVAQDFDLMPYISVEENIQKFLSRVNLKETKQRTEELLKVIEMEPFAKTKVINLSGGQQQRVAIARALAKEPELILLDEPFSQIDNFKKNSLKRSLFRYLKEKNISCIVATHDGSDALSFANQMIVIKNHKLFAKGNPYDVYKNPKDKYVASLFDDVNDIKLKNKRHLLYPHQIKITDSSNQKALVLNSYLKGFYWIIEADYNGQKLYINHNKSFEKGKEISLLFVENLCFE